MKKSKVFLSCGAALLALGILTACGGGGDKGGGSGAVTKVDVSTINKEGFPIVDKELKLTMFAPNLGTDYNKMPVMRYYQKQTNIAWDYTTVPDADKATKLNLAFASNTIPGVLYCAGVSKDQEIQYGGTTLIALEDLIKEWAPNLQAIIDANPNVKKSLTTPDGHIYSLPYLGMKYNPDPICKEQKDNVNRGTLWYNGEWLKKLNLSEPKTIDEFYDMLVKFRDNDPNGNGKADEIALSTSANDGDKLASLRPWILNAFGIPTLLQYQENDVVKFGATQDTFREYLKFMNKLYTEKLLDQEVFTQSDDEKKAKGAADRLGAYMDWFSFFTSNKAEEDAVDDPMAWPLTSKWSETPLVSTGDGISTGTLAITTQCASPEAVLRWADYFYTTEGAQFLNIGPSKEDDKDAVWHWEESDEGEKVRVWNDDIANKKREERRGKITPDYGTVITKVGSPALPILDDANSKEKKGKFGMWVEDQCETKIKPYTKITWPTLYLSKEQSDQIGSTMATDLKDHIVQEEAAFITGKKELNDANWNKFLDELKNIGVEKYVDAYQGAYDAWNKQ